MIIASRLISSNEAWDAGILFGATLSPRRKYYLGKTICS